jgi:hypothetical protein
MPRTWLDFSPIFAGQCAAIRRSTPTPHTETAVRRVLGGRGVPEDKIDAMIQGAKEQAIDPPAAPEESLLVHRNTPDHETDAKQRTETTRQTP